MVMDDEFLISSSANDGARSDACIVRDTLAHPWVVPYLIPTLAV
jgi:hypothetical protein